jgi:hypothetical protein
LGKWHADAGRHRANAGEIEVGIVDAYAAIRTEAENGELANK